MAHVGFEGAEDPEAPVGAEAELAVNYVDLPEPLMMATAPGQPRAQIMVALAIKGNPAELAGMEEKVLSKVQRISAEMLDETEELITAGADSDALHHELPERLRKIVNAVIGTEDWPEPVVEVLITSLAMQE